MVCKACEKRVKDWNGSDPTCAFPSGTFQTGNWNCATANAIRDICYEGEPRDGVTYQYCDDMKYATINTSEIEDLNAYCFWVLWYKSRGETEQIIALGSDGARPASEADCLKVIEYYASK